MNEQHPAQDNNLATAHAATMLRTAANVLLAQAAVLQQKTTRPARAALKRVLSGCLADIETVRVSLKD